MLILNDVDDKYIENHMINTMIIHYRGLVNSETNPVKKRLYEAQLIYLEDIIRLRIKNHMVIVTHKE